MTRDDVASPSAHQVGAGVAGEYDDAMFLTPTLFDRAEFVWLKGSRGAWVVFYLVEDGHAVRRIIPTDPTNR